MQSSPVCNGTVILTSKYDKRTPLVLPLSQNGTVITFVTGMSEMNRVYNATFNLTNANGSFTGILINDEISEVTIVLHALAVYMLLSLRYS
jgi:hypothetical protein